MTQVHRPGPRPTVLASVDGQAYGSLRAPGTPRAERYALGRGLRKEVPRSSLADWDPPDDRRDVLDLLGPFGESAGSWTTDLDMQLRLVCAGFEVDHGSRRAT